MYAALYNNKLVGVIKRQGIKNTIITYIGILIGVVNIIYIQPKFLSEEELGLTRLLYNCAYLIGLAVPLGLPNIIVKYFPGFRNKENGNNGFAAVILPVFFVGFILSCTVLSIFKSAITNYYIKDSALFVNYFMFLIPFTFIVSAITVTTAYCHSLFKSTVPSFLNDICIRVGIMLVTILYFNKIISFDQYIYAFIGLYAVELLILVIFIFLIDKISFKPNKEKFREYPVRQMISYGLLLCGASFASMSLRTIDVIILGGVSLKLVGVYTTAVFIASFIEVPLGALEKISHTKIADNFSKNNTIENEKIYKDSVKYLLLIGGFLFVGINACTRYLYEIGKLSESFSQCINVVYIVSFGSLINISTGINSSLIFYSKYYVSGTLILFVTLIITVALNVALIPLYGIYGAAISLVISVTVFNLIKFVFIYLKFGFQPYSLKSLFIFIVIALCTFIAHILPEIGANPFLNLLYKGATVSIIYVLLLNYFKLAPEVFEGIRRRISSVIS